MSADYCHACGNAEWGCNMCRRRVEPTAEAEVGRRKDGFRFAIGDIIEPAKHPNGVRFRVHGFDAAEYILIAVPPFGYRGRKHRGGRIVLNDSYALVGDDQ